MGLTRADESRNAVVTALSALQTAVNRLRHDYGDTLGVRRLTSDVARLSADLDELGAPHPGQAAAPAEPLETIPDTPYDPQMWEGAEDEGLGAPDRRAP